MGLCSLHSKSTHEETLFWGKISGINNDYYIAVGLNFNGQYEFPSKKFYYCLSNDFTFIEMPELND